MQHAFERGIALHSYMGIVAFCIKLHKMLMHAKPSRYKQLSKVSQVINAILNQGFVCFLAAIKLCNSTDLLSLGTCSSTKNASDSSTLAGTRLLLHVPKKRCSGLHRSAACHIQW